LEKINFYDLKVHYLRTEEYSTGITSAYVSKPTTAMLELRKIVCVRLMLTDLFRQIFV